MNATLIRALPMQRRLVGAALVAALINFYAFYPGLYHHDAWAYVSAVRSGEWTNWQPPLLGVLWIPLQWFWPGPQPMLAIFLAGYWTAFALIALAFRDEERGLLRWLVFATAFFPMALNFNGQLVKDISMSICLLLATSLAALLLRGWCKRASLAAIFMWLFLVMGGFMRANAVFGMPPLIDLAISAVSPRWCAVGLFKRTLIAGVLALLLIPAHLVADTQVFRVRDVKPISPLQIFDMGGIAYYSGYDGFKGAIGRGFIEQNRGLGCYTPRYWDNYGWGQCLEVYENLKPQFGAPLTRLWLAAIAAEPRAYFTHRFAHANYFFQFLCKGCEESVVTGFQSSYQTEVTFMPNPIYKVIAWLSVKWSQSPFGPPYVYLLVCLAWMWASTGIRERLTRHMTFALSASGTMYALPFFVIGIAHEYRYIYWTMLCALIASPVIVVRVVMRKEASALMRFGPLAVIGLVIASREFVVRAIL